MAKSTCVLCAIWHVGGTIYIYFVKKVVIIFCELETVTIQAIAKEAGSADVRQCCSHRTNYHAFACVRMEPVLMSSSEGLNSNIPISS